jgi:hypothetical protein
MDPRAPVPVIGKWRTVKRKFSDDVDAFDILRRVHVVQKAVVQNASVSSATSSSAVDATPLPPKKKKKSYRVVAEESLKELRDAIERCKELNRGATPAMDAADASKETCPSHLKRRVLSLSGFLATVKDKTPT